MHKHVTAHIWLIFSQPMFYLPLCRRKKLVSCRYRVTPSTAKSNCEVINFALAPASALSVRRGLGLLSFSVVYLYSFKYSSCLNKIIIEYYIGVFF